MEHGPGFQVTSVSRRLKFSVVILRDKLSNYKSCQLSLKAPEFPMQSAQLETCLGLQPRLLKPTVLYPHSTSLSQSSLE